MSLYCKYHLLRMPNGCPFGWTTRGCGTFQENKLQIILTVGFLFLSRMLHWKSLMNSLKRTAQHPPHRRANLPRNQLQTKALKSPRWSQRKQPKSFGTRGWSNSCKNNRRVTHAMIVSPNSGSGFPQDQGESWKPTCGHSHVTWRDPCFFDEWSNNLSFCQHPGCKRAWGVIGHVLISLAYEKNFSGLWSLLFGQLFRETPYLKKIMAFFCLSFWDACGFKISLRSYLPCQVFSPQIVFYRTQRVFQTGPKLIEQWQTSWQLWCMDWRGFSWGGEKKWNRHSNWVTRLKYKKKKGVFWPIVFFFWKKTMGQNWHLPCPNIKRFQESTIENKQRKLVPWMH